jgi:predicted transcriptional regulator
LIKELRKGGYSVKDSCNALGISRSRYYSMEETKRAKKERRTGQLELLDRIKEIKTEHPYWGNSLAQAQRGGYC